RPLGAAKRPGEPDQTLLMAHVLFSRSIALRRLDQLSRRTDLLPNTAAFARWTARLETLPVDGLPLVAHGTQTHHGVVSLHDAYLAADDWLILRTTRRTVDDLLKQYDIAAMVQSKGIPSSSQWRIVLPVGGDEWSLRVYDEGLRPLCDLRPDYSNGYASRGGAEFLAGG